MTRRLLTIIAVSVALLLPASVSATDWPTYHGDNTRQGNAAGDQALNAISPSWTTPPLDGAVYGQPVVVGTQVIVATENNSVYSLSTGSGAVQWGPKHIGTPRNTAWSGGCGSIRPLGITGTPAISAGNIFVVAEIEAAPGSFHFDLVTLSLLTGAITRQVNINPADPRFDPQWEQQRPALTVTGGRVFVGLGGLIGDCGNYHGYVLSFPETGAGTETWWAASETSPSNNGGAVWGSGGLSVDAAGYIYAATGNSDRGGSTDAYDYSDSVIKLRASDLAVVDYFAPSGIVDASHDGGPTWYQDNASDTDLGSATPLQLPNGRIFQIGKSGMGYLLNSAGLGHISGGLASHQVCSATADAVFGSLAYAVVNGVETVFVGCSGADSITAVQIANTNNDFSVAYRNSSGVSDKPPIVAGNYVWAVGGSTLYQLSETTLGVVNSFAVSGSDHFTSPTAANGGLYVEAGNQVDAFTGAAIAPVNGFTMDAYGGLYHFGTVAAAVTPVAPPYWPGWRIARGLAVLADHSGGYELDGWGGIHNFGSAPALADNGAYWPGWDIARALVVNGTGGGYTLDGFGGIHAIGNALTVGGTGYWRGWDIARALVLRSDGHSGWVMDAYGGLHAFGTQGDVPANPSNAPYWGGWNIARGLALASDSGGYTLDGYGGVHEWGTAPAINTNGVYWQGWDIARSITIVQGAPTAGYLLDGFGGIHPLGTALGNPTPGYSPGQDTFRNVAATS